MIVICGLQDRFLGLNLHLFHNYNTTVVSHLSRACSDHAPLLITMKNDSLMTSNISYSLISGLIIRTSYKQSRKLGK
ncbi:hypothetical protein H5410_015890 [Solanum commersonii]|uniref:Uncharacterized protein n=1 Tax=Solanum commersonii TaxID=4109 RepID=A0A9J5ZVR8_SOLCO|nr:hypothetical protein H5410_015890 [Solanum commersonii]